MAQVHQQQVTGWTGWVAFASFMVALTGIFHVILGIGGVFGQDWYAYSNGTAWWFDSSTWGWTVLAGGVLYLMVAGLLYAGNMLGRILGVLLALGSLFANMALVSVAPVWSSFAAVLDLFIIYAIIAHGSEMKHLQE